MSTIMTYTDKMDRLDHQMMDEVLRLRESFNPDAFTKEEVFSALEKDSLTKEDFMALLSPAAAPYLEEMARRARAVTKARSLPPFTLPITVAMAASTVALTAKTRSSVPSLIWIKSKESLRALPKQAYKIF